MPGQPLVDEGVVGLQQIDHAAVFAHDALEEQLGLALEAAPQVVVEVGELVGVGLRVPNVPKVQPLTREVSDQRLRLWVGKHAPRLSLEHRRVFSLPALASASSSSSGMLLHRKNESREASSMSLTR